MRSREEKFEEQIARLQKVQKAISELLLKRGPPALTANILSVAQDGTDEPDPIEKCLNEAEKLVSEGKVMAAIEKQAECEKLIGRSQP